ncbi:uncharacterized protein LOC143286881 [Babylonia areolata]|uniref:uncharacterized protein LOC143286881 n=1 Tax=Babylonia areolata TaxID=304850 RepID=UPI003FD3B0FF
MAASATAEHAQAIIDDQSLVEEQLWEELEKEDIPSYIRESRLEALKKQSQQYHMMKEQQHGEYTLLEDEKTFLDTTTSITHCVVHFFHPDFRRCSIIDGHLEKLSQKYFETKFGRISVEKAKFLVNKLKIQVLPAVYCFKKGIVVDKIVGFEELGNTDDFRTEVLERRLAKSGCIEMAEDEAPKTIFGVQRSNKQDEDSSDDDDY